MCVCVCVYTYTYIYIYIVCVCVCVCVYIVYIFLGSPFDSDDKESACSTGDLGSVPGFRRSPGGGNGNPLQYSCLWNHMDSQRNTLGYSPWGCKELDMTEWLSIVQYIHVWDIISLLAHSLFHLIRNIWMSEELLSRWLWHGANLTSPSKLESFWVTQKNEKAKENNAWHSRCARSCSGWFCSFDFLPLESSVVLGTPELSVNSAWIKQNHLLHN